MKELFLEKKIDENEILKLFRRNLIDTIEVYKMTQKDMGNPMSCIALGLDPNTNINLKFLNEEYVLKNSSYFIEFDLSENKCSICKVQFKQIIKERSMEWMPKEGKSPPLKCINCGNETNLFRFLNSDTILPN